MTSKHKHSIYAVFLVTLLAISCDRPDEPDPQRRKSPIAIASINHEDTYVKVVYGQPYKNDREIFGDLVPYDEVWRTGANEATEITTSRDILFAGEELEAGTYALFTIPRPERWTVILNTTLGQWGAFDYDETSDLFRVELPSYSTGQVTEAFTIRIGEVVDDSTSIIMNWDTTEVRIPIAFNPDSV